MQESLTGPASKATWPSPEPMKVAAFIVADHWGTNNLLYSRESFYEYYGNRWQRRSDSWMEANLYQLTEDLKVAIPKKTKEGTSYLATERFAPTVAKIRDLMAAVKSLPGVRRDFASLPVWLQKADSLPAPETCVGFDDRVIDLASQRAINRTANWFDLAAVPVRYDHEAACPLWEASIHQWSQGSSEWKTVLQRWMGYCLMNHRRYAKWLLMYGKSRAGKGTIVRIIQELVGHEAFRSVGVDSFSRTFALQGLENTKVLSFTEAYGTRPETYEKMTSLLKQVVGADPMEIDIRYKESLHNVVLPAAPMVQANEMPKLPDRSGSVSSKMVVLPFAWSARDPGQKENPNLSQQLLAELPGIAAWALQGARELTAANGAFPVLMEAEETIEVFQSQNAPMDPFLERYFVKNPNGFVAIDLLWDEWLKYCKWAVMPNRYTRNSIRAAIKENTSWPLKFHRPPENGSRGLKGLSLRSSSVG